MNKWQLMLIFAVWPLILTNVKAHCDLEGFDLNSLKDASYWSLTIVKEDWNCIVPQGYCTDRITGCTIYFSVCKPLPEGICSNHTNSSTCLVVTTDDNKDHYFNIGSYNARPDHGLVPTESEEIGFAAVRQGSVVNGTSCSGKQYETIMTWRCGPDADWDPSSNDVTIFAIDVTHNSSCSLKVLFDYSGACPPPPTPMPPIVPSATSIVTMMATTPTSTGAHTPTGTPTATPPPYTTNHGQFTSQIPDERQKINIGGLIAGVVIFATVCAILLALIIAAVWYVHKHGGIRRSVPYNDL